MPTQRIPFCRRSAMVEKRVCNADAARDTWFSVDELTQLKQPEMLRVLCL
jgi:hypothetical protein